MIRNPKAVCASLRNVKWEPGALRSQIINWKEGMRIQEKWTADARVFTLRYEDFVREPESCFARLCEFISEPFRLEFEGNGIATRQPNDLPESHPAFKSINSQSIDKWRSILSSEEAAWIEHYAEPFYLRVGYRRVAPKSTVARRFRWRLEEDLRLLRQFYRQIISHII